MKALRTLLLVSLAALGGPAISQQAPAIGDFPRPAEFPKEDPVLAAEYLARARAVAGDDLRADFIHRCITDARYRQRANALQFDGMLGPAKVFDQLYFVGQNAVSAWALDTPDGIIVFDALNNEAEARDILVPAMRQMGLDPARIRYVVITHSHGDHYGGAAWLRETYRARLVSSDLDWKAMDELRRDGGGPARFAPPPARDLTIADGEVLTLGGTRLQFFVTPGHSVGTVSTIFPVTDGGARHMVGFFGGFGAPRDPLQRYVHIASMNRFRQLAGAAGVDAMIANHPLQDGAFEKMELLRYRRPGDGNPFVIGRDRYDRYLQVQMLCSQLGLVRAGLNPERQAP
ncbi:MAG: MBL fold metallo-hydrolase [Sphingomonas sp.]|nr:MBL fold metallo-hydrolase [Sphingomonas sp.]